MVFAILQMRKTVNPYKTNPVCVGFCSIVCLLMAIKFLNDDKHRSLKWLRAKLDGYERTEDDPFSLQKFLYLFHDLNRLGFLKKYNLIVIDYFTNETIVKIYADVDFSKTSIFFFIKNKQSLCLHRENLCISKFTIKSLYMFNM